MNFWQKIKKKKSNEPIICLAPMADVTDRAFRQIIAKYGKPDVLWTEFVSADGLFSGGKEALINDLSFTKKERPIVAQFFTSKPDMMKKASELSAELGFDGIDINMGCPDKSIEKQGAGAALIKNPELAKEIILSAKEGAGDLPVSVKTRIGWSRDELEEWLPKLLEAEPALITIHARTRKELSLVPARWQHVKRAVEIRNEWRDKNGNKSSTLIFGNGDVVDISDAFQKAEECGCDGVMLGRAIFGNPWLFANLSELKNQNFQRVDLGLDKGRPFGNFDREISTEQKLKVLVEHTKLFEKLVQPKPPVGCGKSFAVMKKHFKAYVSGFYGAKELRIKLMDAKDAKEVGLIISDYIKMA